MTSDHILMVREAFPCGINSSLVFREEHQPIKGMQALSCASIGDIIAFRLPCAEQSWCILVSENQLFHLMAFTPFPFLTLRFYTRFRIKIHCKYKSDDVV